MNTLPESPAHNTITIPERKTLRAEVRDALTRAISQGQIQPGERIVESRIAHELGVSQTTVREALRELEATGLVVCETNRGCVVRRLSPDDVTEMYEMRALLESEAAIYALRNLRADDLIALDNSIDEMVRLSEAGDITGMSDVDVRFHQELVEAAKRPLLLRLWSLTNPTLWTHVAIVGILEMSFKEVALRHRQIVKALRSGDPTIVRAAVNQHLLELRDQAAQKLTK